MPKRGHFNGNIAAGIFIWLRIFCAITSHTLLSLHKLTEQLKHKETQVSFQALLQFNVHENTIAS